ncbi:MAG: DNA methyltransferase, partial [Bacilli bacterium]
MCKSSTIFFDNYILELIKTYKNQQKPIDVNFRDLVPTIINMDRYTHFIHSYPAKLLQQIPYFFLNNTVFSKEDDLILDPFCGTGTVLLEASLANRQGIGIDVNPLASLIAKTKTMNVNILDLKQELENINIQFQNHEKSRKIYYVPKISNIDYWYNKKNIKTLATIKEIVNKINDNNVKQFYLVIFSICCKKFSYSDPRVSVPVRINKDKFPQGHPLREAATKNIRFIEQTNIYDFFIEQSKKNIERFLRYQTSLKSNYNNIKIFNCDIKQISHHNIKQESVQLILTSPPYVSAQKYIRASSLSLQWLELNKSTITELDKQSIGREHFPKTEYNNLHKVGIESIDVILTKIYQKNKLRAYITYKYIIEMQESFKYFYSLLKTNGYFVMIIGNNTIAGYE